ncbi:CYTH domain-containing protein [Aquimarina brevivitae]|uniref:CYTH domain-containing protein n=1 Tax=Aquimarina brevivitae TaxID=323412 RepID=A0A4Q7PJJ7_9FLAO|nr:CYTH domain-containing protein [Aquimarina brevivitae]RZS99082.1 CYTH domain-containing protein [Aquimarina brevivitae]
MIEIERKFLVTSDAFIAEANQSYPIKQGFLNTDPGRTVRIRIKGTKAFITVKGKGNTSGTTRFEWEKPIEIVEAESLLLLCEPGTIEKVRYEIAIANHIFEVDVFKGDNIGLILAEIELTNENETFHKPNWLGQEVTGDPKYYNSQLARHPFLKW